MTLQDILSLDNEFESIAALREHGRQEFINRGRTGAAWRRWRVSTRRDQRRCQPWNPLVGP